MCGICGLINYGHNSTFFQLNHIKTMMTSLLQESGIRGSDATGICIAPRTSKAILLKDNEAAREFVMRIDYNRILNTKVNEVNNFKFMLGHTRSEIIGTHKDNNNNHPIVANKVIGVHNGTLTNHNALFEKYRENDKIKRAGEVDSEIIFRLLDFYLQSHSIEEAVQIVTQKLLGGFSCAFFSLARSQYVTLFGGNSPDIYLMDFRDHHVMAFASTELILKGAIKGNPIFRNPTAELSIDPYTGIRINTEDGSIHMFTTKDIINKNIITADKVAAVTSAFKTHLTGGAHSPTNGCGWPANISSQLEIPLKEIPF